MNQKEKYKKLRELGLSSARSQILSYYSNENINKELKLLKIKHSFKEKPTAEYYDKLRDYILKELNKRGISLKELGYNDYRIPNKDLNLDELNKTIWSKFNQIQIKKPKFYKQG